MSVTWARIGSRTASICVPSGAAVLRLVARIGNPFRREHACRTRLRRRRACDAKRRSHRHRQDGGTSMPGRGQTHWACAYKVVQRPNGTRFHTGLRVPAAECDVPRFRVRAACADRRLPGSAPQGNLENLADKRSISFPGGSELLLGTRLPRQAWRTDRKWRVSPPGLVRL